MAANPITITLVDGITKGLKDISVGVNGLGAQFVKLNAGIELVQQSFGLIVDAAQGLGSLVQPAADLEDALAAVQAVTGATAEEFARLKAAAEDASARTRFTAVEAAGGLAELARAGLTATESIEALNPALNLAQGNAIQVSESAQLLTTSLVQFGLATDEASRVADVLQKTADGTSTSVTELGLALGYAAPGAKSLGLSIEETAAAIGIMANNGLRGERAGTVLREVFAQLQTPTSALAKAMKDAGVETGSFSGFLAALGNDGALAQKAMTALGVTGQALRPLIADAGKSIDDFTKVLRDAEGSAAKTAETMGATLNTALAKLSNSFDQVKITLFEPLLEPLRLEIEAAAKEIVAFSKTAEFAELAQSIKAFTLSAVQSIKDFVGEFDFTAAAKGISDFIADATTLFNELNEVFNVAKAVATDLKLALSFADEGAALVGRAFGVNIPVVSNFSAALSSATQAAKENTSATDQQSKSVEGASKKFTELAFSAGAAKGEIAGLTEQAGKSVKPIGDLSGKFEDLGKGIGTTTTLAEFFKETSQDLSGEFSDIAEGAGTAANIVGGLFSQSVKQASADVESLAEKIKSVTSAVEETAPIVLLNFKAMADGSKESLQELQTALAVAFSSKKSLEEAELLRAGLAAAFEAIGLDVAALDDAFKQFQDNLASNDRAKKFSDSLGEIDKAVLSLLTNTKGAQEQINAVLGELFKGETAANAKLLQEQVSAYMLSMGASIETVERAMKGFSDSVKNAALDEQFKLLKIESERSLGAAAKSAEAAFNAIVKGARDGTATLGDVRAAFIAYARVQLDAVKNADELKRAQVLASLESKAAAAGLSESLVELGVVGKDAGEKAARAVKSIAPAADDATKSAQNLSGALAGAGSSAASAAGAIQGNTSALITNSGAAQENAYYVGETSKALADQFRAASFSTEGINQLNRVLQQQNQEAARYVELLREQIALTDPVEQSLERLRNKFRGLGDETLRTIAQLEQQRDRARGTEAGATGEENTTTTSTSAGAPGRTPVVVNLALSALDPSKLDAATLQDFARQLTGPLRQILQSST